MAAAAAQPLSQGMANAPSIIQLAVEDAWMGVDILITRRMLKICTRL